MIYVPPRTSAVPALRVLCALVCSVVLAGVRPSPVAADSDGYYCHGGNYVAYELRFSGPPAAHRLIILSFAQPDGVISAPPVFLEDFQVRAMRCGDGAVELDSASTTYVVDLRDLTVPALAAQRPRDPSAAEAEPSNLGHWGREGVYPLPGLAPELIAELVIMKTATGTEGGVFHYTHSQLVVRDARGTVRDRRVLYDGLFLETVD